MNEVEGFNEVVDEGFNEVVNEGFNEVVDGILTQSGKRVVDGGRGFT